MPWAGQGCRTLASGGSVNRTIVRATALAGTLDILFAMILTLLRGKQIPDMLRFVASGPFPRATDMGTAGAVLGLLVHYALMGIMAATFFLWLDKQPRWKKRPYLAGLIFGLVSYVVMNLLVVPIRFGTPLPPSGLAVATQLFAHIVLVGMVFAGFVRCSRFRLR